MCLFKTRCNPSSSKEYGGIGVKLGIADFETGSATSSSVDFTTQQLQVGKYVMCFNGHY